MKKVELKTARLTVLLDPAKKQAFESLCEQLDLTPSQVIRKFIREYLLDHGVAWKPSGESALMRLENTDSRADLAPQSGSPSGL